jgi:tetratricopeptide (TPR) repeat protein
MFFNPSNEQELRDIDMKLLANAEKCAKTSPIYPRPYKEYFMTIFNHKLMLETSKHKKEQMSTRNDFYDFRTTFSTLKHSCLEDLKNLKPITLREMSVNKIHKGKYLLCKVIEEPYYITAMLTIIQDQNDEIENLSSYNFSQNNQLEPNILLPKNSILIIKEPYLKSMLQMPDNYHIRVDSPTDLIILNETDYSEVYDKFNINKWRIKLDDYLSFDKLNQIGNKYFVEKNYYMAVKTYTKASNQSRLKFESIKAADIKNTLNNRAAAYLRLEKWYMAYQDTLSSLQIDHVQNEKAYFRQGKALYSMRQFEDALAAFKHCLDINPNLKEAKTEIAKCNQRLNESKTGLYDMNQIIHDSQIKKELRLDLADYISNDIEIIEVKANCKGIVAKCDIKKNTLIMASKAASIAYNKECPKEVVLSLNMYNKKLMNTNQCQNLTNLTQTVLNDPFMSREVYKLYSGPTYKRNKIINDRLVDVSRIEAIQTFNSFKSEFISFKIADILKDVKNNKMKALVNLDEENNSGLWIMPSFFNHSCVPNTQRFFFSDFMKIYTSKSNFIFMF